MGRAAVASKRLPSQAKSTRRCPEAGEAAELAEARLEAIEWRAYALAANSHQAKLFRKLRQLRILRWTPAHAHGPVQRHLHGTLPRLGPSDK